MAEYNENKQKLSVVFISALWLIFTISSSGCSTTSKPYAKVGAGYKFQETKLYWKDESSNHPLSARLEIGLESDSITYGVSHHSQWLEGTPINNNKEYSKTELFIDYKWEF